MKIIFKIIKSIVTLFLLIVLSIVVLQKISKNTITLGNIYIFQVVSESMLPEYYVGDIIVVKKTDVNNLKIGDDITYLGTSSVVNGLTITHRIVDIEEKDGKKFFVTKGVSNYIEDPVISGENIYGKVIYHTVLFSFVGRLMTNIYIYYFLFISVGVAFSYELINSFFIRDKVEDDDDENDEEDSIDKDDIKTENKFDNETDESTDNEITDDYVNDDNIESENEIVSDEHNL